MQIFSQSSALSWDVLFVAKVEEDITFKLPMHYGDAAVTYIFDLDVKARPTLKPTL